MISATSDHIVTVCLDFPSPECCESAPVGDVAAAPREVAVFEVLACGSLCMMVKLPWKTLDAKGGVGIAGMVAYRIVAMTVLLLDPRWPEQIPLEVFSGVYGPVSYTEEVPVSVRWTLGDIISGTDPVGQGLLVSTNEADQRVLDRLDRGERVIAARSRDDQLHIARQVMQRARDIGEFELLQTHKTLVPYLSLPTLSSLPTPIAILTTASWCANSGMSCCNCCFMRSSGGVGKRLVWMMWQRVSSRKCVHGRRTFSMAPALWFRKKSKTGCGQRVSVRNRREGRFIPPWIIQCKVGDPAA